MATRLIAFPVALAAIGATAEIYSYHLHLGQFGSQNNLRYRQSGMYSHKDAPSDTPPGYGHSYLDFGNLQFEVVGEPINEDPEEFTFVDIAIFENSHFDDLGAPIPGDPNLQYCCTSWVQNRTGCHPERSLIVDDGDNHHVNGSVELIRVQVPNKAGERVVLNDVIERKFTSAHIAEHHRYKVKKTGLYTVLLANCDAEYPNDILITGETVWMNPYGYLPGELYGMMPFFGVLASLYVVMGFIWIIACARNWNELMLLQMWISLVIGLGMLETTIKFADYLGWNGHGVRDTGALASGLVFGVTKRAVSRVLVLMVSMGYSIVKPTLGPHIPKIAALGVTYFVLAMCYDLVVNLPSANKSVQDPGIIDALTLVVLLMSLVDVIFYMWILQSLVQNINQLAQRQQTIKLQLFRRFRFVLIISVVFSVCWAIYTMVASVEDYFLTHWKSKWNVNAVWEVIYLAILAAISFLWRPTENSSRYAYYKEQATEDMDDDEDDDELDEDDEEFGGALPDEGLEMAPASEAVLGTQPAEKMA